MFACYLGEYWPRRSVGWASFPSRISRPPVDKRHRTVHEPSCPTALHTHTDTRRIVDSRLRPARCCPVASQFKLHFQVDTQRRQCRINANRGPWQLFARGPLLTRDRDLSKLYIIRACSAWVHRTCMIISIIQRQVFSSAVHFHNYSDISQFRPRPRGTSNITVSLSLDSGPSHSSRHDMLAIISSWYQYGPFLFQKLCQITWLLTGWNFFLYFRRLPWGLWGPWHLPHLPHG